jgi:hypothetical protein
MFIKKNKKKLALRAIQAGVPTKLVGKLSHSLCQKSILFIILPTGNPGNHFS